MADSNKSTAGIHYDQSTSEAYSLYRPLWTDTIVGRVMDYVGEKLPGPPTQAIDVGCGTGQFTTMLAPYFQRVIGLDPSPYQVENANKGCVPPNVTYQVGNAEKLPVPNDSADLVTAATAAHWFDMNDFYKESARILRPNGCLAVLYYDVIPDIHGSSNGDAIKRLLDEYFILLQDRNMWVEPAETNYVTHFARDVDAPFPKPFVDYTREDSLDIKKDISVSEILGYVKSWSSTGNLMKTCSDAGSILERLESSLRALWPDSHLITVTHPVWVRMARKS
ncbi:putative methyltransferase DDB_G0268948 [Lingula anatina]|uniref:Methyltransferase DDB_G0268948 n=1 Tax=Lingula anatina TaxID=7574 RepID=A0A1S3JNE6_LINAN|nr:putative methyltransferase DDB_G0268948 [Lingula anatina]|eukprot:XP_013411892.1 putative methyltransferase DDB_G0268948 [Lingula anatina]